MRFLDPIGSGNGFLGDTEEFSHKFAQSRAGESFLNSGLKELNRLDDVLRFEQTILPNGFLHNAISIKLATQASQRPTKEE